MALDFLILYEHTVREYESDLLLKLELERRGYTVRIRQLLDAKDLRLFGKDKPEVLVASCMYDNEAINSHVYNNIGKCNKIVNLHWEQMLSDTQEEGDWFNMNGNAKRCVQTCWGQRTAQRLQAHGMDAKNTPVTGAVMMDFLRPEFKGYFKDKETLCKEFGLDPAKQLHLYISSFGYASMTDQEVAELSKMAGTDFSGFARTNRVSMEKTLAWFDRYLGDHPEVELVYRRHPSEWKCKALDELAAKRPNFHVIFADSVKQWIVAADSISIWMSTAVAEVYMAGKSCHILRPVPIEHEYDPVIYKDAHYVTSYPEFAAAMAQPNPPFPIARVVIEGYFDPSLPRPTSGWPTCWRKCTKIPRGMNRWGPALRRTSTCSSSAHWRGYTCCTATSGNPNGCLPSARRWPTLPSAFTVMWTKPISRRRRSSAWKRASGHM